MIKHKLFLRWLVYVVVVLFGIVAGFHFNLIQFMIQTDSSRLTLLICILYVLTEIYLGFQHWQVSRELGLVEDGITALTDPTLRSIRDEGDRIMLSGGAGERRLEESPLSRHVRNLIRRQSPERTDQETLLLLISDKAFTRSERGVFMADIITLFGLLGTMVGLIMAFLPFFQNSFDASRGAEILNTLFAGVSTAFFTTAAAIAFSILIRVNAKHLEGGLQDMMTGIAATTETSVMPRLQRMGQPVPVAANAAQ
jgi:biopolymer transport protein ExbB/TolQ